MSLKGSTGALLSCEKVPDSEREGEAFSSPARGVSGDQGPRPGPLELGPVGTGSLVGALPTGSTPRDTCRSHCARRGGVCGGRRLPGAQMRVFLRSKETA